MHFAKIKVVVNGKYFVVLLYIAYIIKINIIKLHEQKNMNKQTKTKKKTKQR